MWFSNEFSQVNMRTNEMQTYLNAVKQDKSNYSSLEKARIIKFISYTLSLIDEEISIANQQGFDFNNYSNEENPVRLQTINRNMLSFAQWCEPVTSETNFMPSNVPPVSNTQNVGISNSYVEHQNVTPNNNGYNGGQSWTPPPVKPKKQLSSEDIIARIFNVLGLFLLLAGAIAIFSMSAEFMSPAIKGILVAAMGVGMVFWGCVVAEKNKNLFSLGVMSGGLTLIYTAIALGSFAVDLLPAIVGLILTMCVTLLAVWLALKYNSQLIAVFAMIGGYLPLIQSDMYSASPELMTIYFASLALGCVFLVSLKPWHVASYIGLVLNIIADIMLINAISLDIFPMVVIVSYILICFVAYTLLPVIRKSLSNSGKLENYVYGLKDDIFNIITAVLFSIVFIVECNVIDVDILDVILFVVAGLYYIGLSKWLDLNEHNSGASSNTLFVVGLTFIPTILVTKLSVGYLGVAWAFEATALAWRGYMNDKKFLKAISWVVLACSCICLMVTTETADSEVGNLLSMVAIALSYIGLLVLDHHNNKGDKSGLAIFTSIFKVINLPIVAVVWYYITTWIYDNIFVVEYTSSVLYNDVLDIESLFSVISFSLTALVLSFVVNIACKNRDKVLYYGSLVFGFIWAFVGLFYSGVNVVDTYDYFEGAASNFVSSVEILSVFSGIAFILVSCYLLYVLCTTLFKVLGKDNKASLLIVTIYGLILLSIKVGTNFLLIENEDTCSILLTVVYLAIAALWMTRGLTTSFTAMKISGLVLAVISLLKICLFDSSSIDDNLKPIVYIISAVICLAIVRVYTYFSKKYSVQNQMNSSNTNNYMNYPQNENYSNYPQNNQNNNFDNFNQF